MAPSKKAYVIAQKRKRAMSNPLNEKLVSSSAPSTFGSKKYWDKIRIKRDKVANIRSAIKKNKTASKPGYLYNKLKK